MAIPNTSEKSVALDREENYKECSRCYISQSLHDYYKHATGKDGHQTVCKSCKRLQHRNHYKKVQPYRLAKIKNYQKTEAYKVARLKSFKNDRSKNFAKYSARRKLHYAVKTGLVIKPNRCSSCSVELSHKEIQAHHVDYSKPLDVVWLCWLCHKEEHQFLIFDRRKYVYTK